MREGWKERDGGVRSVSGGRPLREGWKERVGGVSQRRMAIEGRMEGKRWRGQSEEDGHVGYIGILPPTLSLFET